MHSRARLAFWIAMAMAAGILLIGAVSVPVMDPDESRFARTSVEMLRSGDLVVPHFEGRPRLVKPPLVHWVQSWLFSLFGVSPLVVRLHAILATLGSIALVGWIGRKRFGDEGGAWAAAVMATIPLVIVPGKIGTLDALLSVHVLAVIALDLAAPDEEIRYRAAAMGGLMGLGFLVKGPVAVVLPLLVMLAGRTASRRAVLPTVSAVLQAAGAFAVVVLPWGLAFLRRVGAGTTGATLRGEVLERYFAGTAHVEPPWYYGKVVAVAFLPWVAPMIIALIRAWRLRREGGARTALYAGAGFVAGLVFFSIGQSKLPTYILPLAPLAAVLVTWEIAREVEAPRHRIAGPASLSATLSGCAVLLGLAAALQLEGEARIVAALGALFFALGGGVAGVATVRRRPRLAYGAAVVSTACFLLVTATVLFPAVGRERSAAGLVEEVPELATPRPIVTVEMKVPGLTFHLDRIPEVVEARELETRLAREDDPLFVFADVDLLVVPEETLGRLVEIGRRGKFVVYRKAAVSADDR